MSSVTVAAAHDGDAAQHSGASLQLANVCRSFGSVRALDGLSLDIASGELVAFLGPSGCGKTTALMIIAGLEEADSGQVLLDGRDIGSLPANRRGMGMVFQAYSLFPTMTARDNVAYGLRMRHVSKKLRHRRADDLLELVGLASHADHLPHQLSGGQQQRVALARALAIEPRVLLLDEPLSALDAKVRGELRDEIRRVQLQVGTTTVFVTHDQEEAFVLADRVAVMNEGHLQQVGTPTEIYERPRTQFVAQFVGLTNCLPARADGGSVTVLGCHIPLLPEAVQSGEVTALVRPESMEVVPSENGNGRILSVSFRGSICVLRVQLDSGQPVLVQLPSAQSAQFASDTRVRVGVRQLPVLTVAAGAESAACVLPQGDSGDTAADAERMAFADSSRI